MGVEVNIVVIGSGGYWGSKLVERFEALLPLQVFRYDPDKGHPGFGPTDFTKLLEGKDACVIATPSSTHYEIARQCLNAGKHVLVEKPMTLDYAQATELVELAKSKKLTLMTDSTFLYSNAIYTLSMAMAHPDKNGIITIPSYNLGLTWTGKRYGNTPEDVLWTYGPHPISIALALMKSAATVESCVVFNTETRLLLSFAGSRTAEIVLDWETIIRRRELLISDGGKIRQVDLVSVNASDYEQKDPLTHMCAKFLQRIKQQELFVDYLGLEVVKALEEAEECKSR